MPGQFFNFTRYFKKDSPGNKSDDSGSDIDEKQTTTVTTATSQTSQAASPVAYSGIGNPPGGVAYSGIGPPPTAPKPPAVGQVSQATTVTHQTTSEDKKDEKKEDQPSGDNALASGTTQTSAIDMKKRVGMDVLSRLTQRANTALMKSVNKARELKLQYIDTEHVLWGILQDSSIYQLISECKAVPAEIQQALEKGFKTGKYKGTPQFSPRVKRVLELSLTAARSLGYEFISPEHILLALSHEGEGVAAQILTKHHLTQEVLNQKITGKKELEKEKQEKKSSSMEQFAEDLTAKASRGELDPVVGRSWEIERIIHIISRRTKNNPVLIGDAGVGKTAIVEGLALRIAHGDVPETLLHKRILQLDLMSLIAGARHRGEFEERLKNLIKEVKAASGEIILFIDEIHNMVGAGSGSEGTMDASNILKPSLARGELQVVGTTTITEYRKYIEKDPALERRFQPVLVSEPDRDKAIEMLMALRDKYEAFHRVKIPDETIESAVHLSQRYINDRFLPDKAVDLIDEAAASVRLPAISLPEEIKTSENKLKKLQNEKSEAEKMGDTVRTETLQKEIEELTQTTEKLKEQYQIKKSTTTNDVKPEVIAEIVSRWTNIPVSRLTESESAKLMELENTIHKRLINQEEAVTAIAEAVRRGRAGLKSNKRPIGSFIFMGPTGVGKTELAKSLAEVLFGSEEMMVRLDMTEYMEKHEVAKLIGAPPGYVGYEEGGQLTEAVRRRPYSVVLLDEIEKAHPDVFNILIQLLDDGRLTDNKGHTVSFKNSIIICTSNLGSNIIQEEILSWAEKHQELADSMGIGQKTDDKKQELFRTYTVSPTGRQLMTWGENYWEIDNAAIEWKKGLLKDYFAGCTIVEDQAAGKQPDLPTEKKEQKSEFPINGFDTHLIAADGAETITRDDRMWFRTSTTAKEWISGSLLNQFKSHIVINAFPDKPDQQLPTAHIDTHAVSAANTEIISLGERFWRRENLQVKDWTTGLLSEYFSGHTLQGQEQEDKDKDEQKEKSAKDKDAKKGDKSSQGQLIQNRSEKKEEEKETDFPLKKWDLHLYKPTGEELIISGSKYWQRKNSQETQWQTGSIDKLFPVTLVAGDKKGEKLPVFVKHGQEKEDKEDLQFMVLARRLMEELRKFFRPELLNRFDEVVIFRLLGRKHMMQIVDLQLNNLSKLLTEQNIALVVSVDAKVYLAEVGFDPVYGARPLRRTIQRFIENPISTLLIKNEVTASDTVMVDFDGHDLIFDVKKMVVKKTKEVEADGKLSYHCRTCDNKWQIEKNQPVPTVCPQCGMTDIEELQAPVEDTATVFKCNICSNQWQIEKDVPEPTVCPKCGQADIVKLKPEPAASGQAKIYQCNICSNQWQIDSNQPKPAACPKCGMTDIVELQTEQTAKAGPRAYKCMTCGNEWQVDGDQPAPTACPKCGKTEIEELAIEPVQPPGEQTAGQKSEQPTQPIADQTQAPPAVPAQPAEPTSPANPLQAYFASGDTNQGPQPGKDEQQAPGEQAATTATA